MRINGNGYFVLFTVDFVCFCCCFFVTCSRELKRGRKRLEKLLSEEIWMIFMKGEVSKEISESVEKGHKYLIG